MCCVQLFFLEVLERRCSEDKIGYTAPTRARKEEGLASRARGANELTLYTHSTRQRKKFMLKEEPNHPSESLRLWRRLGMGRANASTFWYVRRATRKGGQRKGWLKQNNRV